MNLNRWLIKLPVAILFVLAAHTTGFADPVEQNGASANSSLGEVRNKRRALLVVFRSNVIDASGADQAIIEQVLKADPVPPKGRQQWVYGQLAKKLNGYIRKYRSLTPARDLEDADFVIYFNLIEYRRILNGLYPYGELFVILKGQPETNSPPKIVWRSRKILWASDAIGDLIKEFKTLRGEG